MLVAMQDNSKLRAPIAQMIISNYCMAQEAQCSCQAIAQDGATKMAHMHGFCNIRRAKINYEGFNFFRLKHTKPWVCSHLLDFLSKPLGFDAQI